MVAEDPCEMLPSERRDPGDGTRFVNLALVSRCIERRGPVSLEFKLYIRGGLVPFDLYTAGGRGDYLRRWG